MFGKQEKQYFRPIFTASGSCSVYRACGASGGFRLSISTRFSIDKSGSSGV